MSQIQDLLRSIQVTKPQGSKATGGKESGGNVSELSFGETVGNFLKEVNESSSTATKEVANIIQGNSEDLAQAMIRSEEAKINFELMLEIRNKLLDSYKEIQRMQI